MFSALAASRHPAVSSAMPSAGSARKPDRRDLMRPYAAKLMRMWAISTRVNRPQNDDPSLLDPLG